MITVFFAELDAIELLMLPEFQMLPKSTSSLLDVRNLAITLDLLRALIYWLLTYAATLITVKRMHSSILIREIFTPLCFFETKDNGRKFISTHQLQELLLEADAELSPVYWDHYKKVQGAEDAEQSPEYCFSCCVYFKCVLRILR